MPTLTEALLGNSNSSSEEPSVEGSLTDSLLSNKPTRKEKLKAEAPARMGELKAFGRGAMDVLNTAATGVGYVDKTLNPQNAPMYDALQQNIKTQNTQFDEANPPSQGWLPTTPEVARTAGQIVATAPLLPARLFKATQTAMGAANGVVRKLGASAVTGGMGGTEFGALTSSSNDKSLAENAATGLITGSLAGPVLTTAGAAGSKVLPTIRNLWANVNIAKLSNASGLEPSSVKNIIQRLDDAGHTPQTAQVELNRLGSTATLADLDASLTAEAGALAKRGGKSTAILENRFATRKDAANNNAVQLMESKLGPRLDIEAEREGIHTQATNLTSADYKLAHANKTPVDVSGVITNIDKQLETAVGKKAAALKEIRGYFFKDSKDAQGNVVKTLKTDVKGLHEIRQQIDELMNDKNPTTSYGKNTLSAIEAARTGLDTQLKLIPEMASADAKFAQKMKVKDSLNLGYDALSKTISREEFAKAFDSADAEGKAAIQKGLRASISTLMDKAQRGELAGAQQLLGKKSVNRANLEKAFGSTGTEVLDALQKEATFRNTESTVSGGSQTARNASIQQRYAEHPSGGIVREGMKGLMFDVVMGTPGGAAAISALRQTGQNFQVKVSHGRLDRLAEGTSDLLSRQASARDNALTVLNTVKTLQDKTAKPFLPKLKLPFAVTNLGNQEAYGGAIGRILSDKLNKE